MAKSANYVGKSLTIKKGAYVTRAGKLISIRSTPTRVTVLAQEPAKGGKTRVYWKSNGLKVSTLV
jgi:hypothetical protein